MLLKTKPRSFGLKLKNYHQIHTVQYVLEGYWSMFTAACGAFINLSNKVWETI